MYIKPAAHHFLEHQEELRIMSRRVAKKNNLPAFVVAVKAVFNCLFYGTIYTEYEALDFIHRKGSNKKTYVTVIWLLQTLRKYNPLDKRSVFHDKREFNNRFEKYVGRSTIDLSETADSELFEFLQDKDFVVLKKADGCSGKQVEIYTVNEDVNKSVDYIRHHDYNMVESYIQNCDEIKAFNPTSLNTLRIVTIHSNNVFNVVCACLRIGAKGLDVDNVSRGGAAASIDINTGRINSVFVTNAYREIEGSQGGRNEIGFQIPYWTETLDMLRNASRLVPDIHIVGWDVAITPNGPVIIEGNESFHTDVMQFYYGPTEPGVKARFVDCLGMIDEDMQKNN